MIKSKPCKGTGKAKGYGCGKMTEHRVYGLGKMCCYSDWLLNSEQGKIKLAKATLKATKPRKDLERAKKNLTDWNKKLQAKINKIVRLIDYGQPCLARNYFPKQMHAGHVFSRGSNPMLRFNLHNIHRQSAQSNHFQNEDGLFREGIVNEYGKEYFDYISELRQVKDLKINTDTYIDLCKKASKIALRMSKNPCKLSLDERIKKRNEINLELGIYNDKHCQFKI